MSARVRLVRTASIALTSLLVIGGALVSSSAAYAVAEDPATQTVETAPEEAPAPAEDGSDSNGEETTADEPAAPETSGEDPDASAGEGETTEGTDDSPGASEAPADDAEPTESQTSESAIAGTEADSEIEVTEGSLSWGVKESFRNYITGPIAQGDISIVGDAAQTSDGKSYLWSGGTGTAASSGDSAEITFSGGSGVHFVGHHGILDITLTNPRIEVTSATTAKLYVDAKGYEFKNTTETGDPYDLPNTHMADLTLPAPTQSDGETTWTEATATLSDEGVVVFGGGAFYEAGTELDPVTFSTGATGTTEPPVEAVETTTTVTADASTAVQGARVVFTATVEPKDAAGTVQFSRDGDDLGTARTVKNGTATVNTKALAVGDRDIVATFTPSDAEQYTASTSKAVTVTVTADPSKPVESTVDRSTLSWGVKETFRNYIYNFTVFEGDSKLLGNTTQREKSSKQAGVFNWSGGTGTIATKNREIVGADVKYGKANGVHFQSHPMDDGNGGKAYALDMTFTNVHVVITSATTAELRLDADGYEFKSMTEIGEPFHFSDVVLATLDLPTPTQSGKTFTWTGAPATLTEDGAVAFGGFYNPGDALDPVTFAVNSDADISVKKPTTTKLSASAEKIEKGRSVTLTAATSPKSVGGSVAFTAGGKQIGKAVTVKNGKATKTVSLPVGIHSVSATFTPSGSIYGRSISGVVKVAVTQPQTGGPSGPGGGSGNGQAAGSLSWGISKAFVAYTTCDNKEAFGYSHCAKGSIDTSGVGSGYLFPQASSSNWNTSAQTGTVNYSGTVTFKGYGMTMFNVSNPSITVNSATSATLNTGNSTSFGSASYQLDLGSASKTVGANGEVTWSGVPVRGSLSSGGAGGSGDQSIALDALTFTVGSASSVSFGSTQAGDGDDKKYTAADTAPTTAGITVLTDREKIRAGGRIELAATGFEADDEGILVVLYDEDGTNPQVLDDAATATDTGAVSWQGTLPKEAVDEHIITFQGSADAGAVIDLVAGDKKSAGKSADAETLSSGTLADREVAAAGIFAPVGGMALWEWWASAGGLVVIAACMTALAIRQRRSLG